MYPTSRATDHIVEYSYYGDWSPPVREASSDSIGDGAVSSETPGALISTTSRFETCTPENKGRNEPPSKKGVFTHEQRKTG